MKEIKIENQTVVVNTENKDIELDVLEPNGDTELYAIVSDGEDTWHIVNENGEVIDTITKDIVVNYCKRECEENDTDYMSSDGITDSVWWNLDDDYNLEYVDNYCQEFDKFLAWFDYTCVEYLAKEIVTFYKQRLLNFE